MAKSNNDHLHRALKLIDSDSRGLFIEELSQRIGETVTQAQGKTAFVSSAVELSDAEKQRIDVLVHSLLKRDMDLVFRVDSKLLGGFSVTVGDWKLDATIVSQLKAMKEALGGKK